MIRNKKIIAIGQVTQILEWRTRLYKFETFRRRASSSVLQKVLHPVEVDKACGEFDANDWRRTGVSHQKGMTCASIPAYFARARCLPI